MSKRPPKITSLLHRVRACVEIRAYRDTYHSADRKNERNITRPEVEYVLKNGRHEAMKDVYEEVYGAWNYAIRGRTIDSRELRVIVSFDESGLLIITAIDLSE